MDYISTGGLPELQRLRNKRGYIESLISAIPVPDPIIEKQKKLFVYDPAKFHDYSVNKPSMVDLGNGHFIYGSEPEIENYRKIRFGS